MLWNHIWKQFLKSNVSIIIQKILESLFYPFESQLKMNVKFLKSPLMFGAALNFAIGNFIVTIAMSLWNDVLIWKIPRINDESISYTEYYKVSFRSSFRFLSIFSSKFPSLQALWSDNFYGLTIKIEKCN